MMKKLLITKCFELRSDAVGNILVTNNLSKGAYKSKAYGFY